MGFDLHIQQHEGHTTAMPVIRCDHCDESIDGARDGVFTWSANAVRPTARAIFLHKGSCAQAFLGEAPPPESWDELAHLPAALALALGLTLPASRSLYDDAARCKVCNGLMLFIDPPF